MRGTRTRETRRKAATLAVLPVVGALLLTGCLQNPNKVGAPSGGGDTHANNAEVDGDKVVTILGTFGGFAQEQFNESVKEFEAETGIDIQYTADQDFTNLIRLRTQAGQQPDIAIFPQPGGLLDLATQGYIEPLDTYMDFDQLSSTLVPGFLDSTRLNGRYYGAPILMSVKSMVFYPKEAGKAAGFDNPPANLDEMKALTDKIRESGTAPWCMGWGADQSTGWVGTDWIEEFMLRLWGPDVYDQWVSNKIPFNDERVLAAFDAFEELIKTDGNVIGGPAGALATPFSDAMLPAFENPPRCMMERQGSFVTALYPDDVKANLDKHVGLFVFPPAAEGDFTGQPILGAGDIAALMNGDDEDARAVMKFITSDKFGEPWAKAGGFLSAHKTFDQSLYPDEVTRVTAAAAASADVFRFDGSDLMPNAVGGGTFWTGMVEWLSGQKTAEQVTQEIQDSWPKDDAPEEEE